MIDRAPRYDIHEDVKIASDSGEEFGGISLNISESGALLRTKVMKPRGTELELRFPSFSAKAKVIWIRQVEEHLGFLLGIRFTEMSGKDRKTLNALLEIPADDGSEGSFRWGTKARTPLGTQSTLGEG